MQCLLGMSIENLMSVGEMLFTRHWMVIELDGEYIACFISESYCDTCNWQVSQANEGSVIHYEHGNGLK